MDTVASLLPSEILVTGGNGRLGRALSAAGCTALARSELDISDAESVARALETHQPRLVINAAAYTAVDQAETDRLRANEINHLAAGRLAQQCRKSGAAMLHISTDCVFPDAEPDHPVAESARPQHLSYYGETKLRGEELVLNSAGNVCVTRVSWLFDHQADTFIGKILAAAQKRDTLKVVDEAYGRPTSVVDLAAHLLELAKRMTSDETVPDILHLGPPGPVSRYEWAAEIFAASAEIGGPNPVLEACPADAFPEPARRPRGLILDVSCADALLGPMPDWRPACRESVHTLLA